MPRIIIADEEKPQDHRSCLEMVGCLVVGGLAIIGAVVVLLVGIGFVLDA
jgi:hypothetical protein